jgi:hypothetical protein
MPNISMEFVVGMVDHPDGSTRVLVTGFEFYESPGFYEFCAVNTQTHFRKRPSKYDNVFPIDSELFHQLRNEGQALWP